MQETAVSAAVPLRTDKALSHVARAATTTIDTSPADDTQPGLTNDRLNVPSAKFNLDASKVDVVKTAPTTTPVADEGDAASSSPADASAPTFGAEARVAQPARDTAQFSEPSVLRLPPHAARLDQGPVQAEILRFSQTGGGEIQVELTPPDQTKFTVTLKLDGKGEATLIVDGGSDSTRARLEQSAQGLREQFAQMGLNLNMNMNAHHQSASHEASTHSQDGAPMSSGSGGGKVSPEVIPSRQAGARQQLISIYA